MDRVEVFVHVSRAFDFNGVGYLGTFCCVERLTDLSAGAVLRGGFSVVSLVPYRMEYDVT